MDLKIFIVAYENSIFVNTILIMNDKNNPFQSKVLEHRILTAPGAVRTTYHISLDLSQNPNDYKPGDTLGIVPHNTESLVDQLCNLLKVNERTTVTLGSRLNVSVREALTHGLDLHKIPLGLWKLLEDRCQNKEEQDKLLECKSNKLLKREIFLDVLDVLEGFPHACLDAELVLPLLTPLKPRLYSIASSLSQHPQEVHVLIAAVKTKHNNRIRHGVCSSDTCLSLQKGDDLTIFFVKNKHFRLPETPNTPIIMIGPGTGLAPFRSFLQERTFHNESENWLFFGTSSKEKSFLYRDELEILESQGDLKLSTVFSDKKEYPYYVQHSIELQAKEFWYWIQTKKAYLFICGDAEYMAKDVQKSLEVIFSEQGLMSIEDAQLYIKRMKKDKRFLLDIY